MDVTICIATYGSPYWYQKGYECIGKIRETFPDTPSWFQHETDKTLAEVRNFMLNEIDTDYVIFLDADDSLHPDYLERMAEVQPATVTVPAVAYVRNRVTGPAHIPKVPGCPCVGFCGPACLDRGNYVVIGAKASTAALRAVGGFREWPMYEDWDLWLRVANIGGSFVNCPRAIYYASFNENSRNRAPTQMQKLEAHRMIARANGVWVP
jgi:glycosyltransferase involved in cell wall biosynthesis